MILDDYDLAVFAKNRSPAGNLPFLESFEDGGAINVGGVLVMPGDVIVADDDGVIVVPSDRAEEVIDWIEEQEEAEEYVIGLIDEERVPPGTYYPISEEIKDRFRKWKSERGE
jgi:regulator of RNase E activity RraA